MVPLAPMWRGLIHGDVLGVLGVSGGGSGSGAGPATNVHLEILVVIATTVDCENCEHTIAASKGAAIFTPDTASFR
jgi:hypothetical protein